MGVSPPRLELPQPIAATLVDMDASIIEISLVGCAVRHPGRVTVGSKVALHFVWHGKRARLDAKVARSTMEFTQGKAVYVSGLQFAETADAAPEVVRSIVKSLIPEAKPEPERVAARYSAPAENGGLKPAATPKPKPQPITYTETVPFLVFDEPEPESEPLFLRCRLVDGRWHDERVSDASQPDDGFTVRPDTADLDGLRRTYEVADADTRRLIRFSFEIEIEQHARA